MTSDVIEWWIDEHAHTLCAANMERVHALVLAMLACMRGQA